MASHAWRARFALVAIILLSAPAAAQPEIPKTPAGRVFEAWLTSFKSEPLSAAGKYADVIAVRGDVLHHVDLLSNVDVVVKHGVRYK